MRILAIVAVIFLLPGASGAETIRLKNGRTIAADRVRESGDRVEYEIGENTFAIRKSAVAGIDTGVPASVPAGEEIQAIGPAQEFVAPNQAGLAGVVVNGKVQLEELLRLERTGSADVAAAAYFLASRAESDSGNRERSREYLARAILFAPESARLREHMAAVLLMMSRWHEAVREAEYALRLDSQSAEGHGLLGYALLQSDRAAEAARMLRRSVELRPNPTVQSLLERAERELKAESGYRSEASSHFNLRFEGRAVPEAMRSAVLATLEQKHAELVSLLGIWPRERIAVILSTEEAFQDVTQAPSWSAGVNDGRIRVAVSGLQQVTPQLARVLAHELAHSFVAHITRGRAPQWLHEGIAQIVEGRSTERHGRMLANLYATQSDLPFSTLEEGYTQLSRERAVVAYAQALAAAEFIRARYGMTDLVRVLSRIGEGMSTEAALRGTIRSGYAELARDLGAHLQQQYGR